jgi:transcriptional regulator with XRE-family HTH domain
MVHRMTLHRRIREARKHAGLTQERLGERIGVTKQAVTQWERDRFPERENLIKIADATCVPLGWLATGVPLPERTQDGTLKWRNEGGRTVPLTTLDHAIAGTVDYVTHERMPAVFPCGNKAFAVIVMDRSNAPTIAIGDRLIVDPDQTCQPNDIVLAASDGRPVIGELRYETTPAGHVVVVAPLNTSFPAARSDLAHILLVGPVAEHTRSLRGRA